MKIDLEKIKSEKSTEDLLRFSILNIDKPTGPTSFQISDFVCKLMNATKTSHMGTLDPQVTGVLPITLNRACRLSGVLMGHDKSYVGIMRLHEEIPEADLRKEMKKFIGKIKQLPPVRSSVKRAEREREIKTFEILEISRRSSPQVASMLKNSEQNSRVLDIGGKDVLFQTEVQAGTYIRKLVHDLGENIGGAHMLELRRTKAGIFGEENLVSLYELEKAVEDYKSGNEEPLRKILIPAEIISQAIPTIFVKKESLPQLLTGKPIFHKDLLGRHSPLPPETKVAVFQNDRFVEIAKVIDHKEIFAKPEFVLN